MFHWQDQIRVHETLVPTDSHFSENHKRIIFENEVYYFGSLRAIKDQYDHKFSHSGRELIHDQ